MTVGATAAGSNWPSSRAATCRVWPAATAACTVSGVAWGSGFWPTATTGACSQRPRHGAATSFTPVPSVPARRAISPAEPARAQATLSQTRTVVSGARASSGRISKW